MCLIDISCFGGEKNMYKCNYCGAKHYTARHANECCNAFKHLYKKLDGKNVVKSSGLPRSKHFKLK